MEQWPQELTFDGSHKAMKRVITHVLIRIVSGLASIEFAIFAFHSARERNLPALCMQLGVMLSLAPYAIYPEQSPFLHHGKETIRNAIVSMSQNMQRAERPRSGFVSMSIGSMIFFGVGLALFFYDHFIK